jgi:hypothetical protein
MRFILFSIFWLLAKSGTSQETIKAYDRIGILIGGQQTHLLDQQFSPMIYKANEICFKLYYEAEHHRSNWNASIDATTGSLFPPQYADRMVYNTTEDIDGHITTDSFLVVGNTRSTNLQLGYAYDLVQSGPWEFSMGAAVRNQLMYPTTFVNLGIMNAASLLLTVKTSYAVNDRNQLSLGAGIPVIGFNTRFPYSGTVSLPNQTLLEAFFDGGTQFVSFGTYNQVNVNCAWRMALSDKMGIGLQYDFMWQQYTTPALLKQYAGRIGATIDINF